MITAHLKYIFVLSQINEGENMFKVKSTGKNINYGKKGEIRFICDSRLASSLRCGYIENTVEYAGNGHEFNPSVGK